MSPAASPSLRRLAAIFSGMVEWGASSGTIRSCTTDRSFTNDPAVSARIDWDAAEQFFAFQRVSVGDERYSNITFTTLLLVSLITLRDSPNI